MKKTALITGISGQDGSYLSKLLLKKGYKVIGIGRNTDLNNYRYRFLKIENDIEIYKCDLSSFDEVFKIIEKIMPDEIYNLAAQSSVGKSFQEPNDTFTFNTQSVMNLLETIRILNKEIRYYQASSSEMFGNVNLENLPIKESLLFHPVSPYGISKASAHWLAVNYREAFGLYTACGILFNHESALRGENFVIKKIINTTLKIKDNKEDILTLGNLAVSRDWGYAPKYVEAMWKMLQVDKADDYIICSGHSTSLQHLVFKVFEKLDLDINKHLRLDQKFMRNLDLSVIYGDNSKAKNELKWDYNLGLDDLVIKLIEDERHLIDFLSR